MSELKSIILRLDEELKHKFRVAAVKEKSSMQAELEKLVKDYVKKKENQ